MTIQIQKRANAEAVEVLDLAPFCRVIELTVARWKRMVARRAVRSLFDALALIADRVAREPNRQAYAATLKRGARSDRLRARQLRDGEDLPPLSPADLKALADADRVEARAVKGQRGAPAIRAQAGRQRNAVGDRIKAAAEARRADMRLAQSVALDAEREGEDPSQVLEKRRGQTQIRLRTRDGLKLIHERGGFTPKDGRSPALARIEADRLLSVGLRYRDRYEIAQSSLRSCLATPDRAPPSRNMFMEGRAAQRRAALANAVRVLDIAVVVRHGPEALEALRMVAGEARTVRSLTGSARKRERLAAGLTAALTVIADMLASGA